MTYRLLFSPNAKKQLKKLSDYIAEASSLQIAIKYGEAIISYCESLTIFPFRGVSREDVYPGLKLTHYKKRTVIAYLIKENDILIVAIFYGGQNYKAILTNEAHNFGAVVD